jgi:hypothetical protein
MVAQGSDLSDVAGVELAKAHPRPRRLAGDNSSTTSLRTVSSSERRPSPAGSCSPRRWSVAAISCEEETLMDSDRTSPWSRHHYEGAAGPVRMPGKAKPKARARCAQATHASRPPSPSPRRRQARRPGASEAKPIKVRKARRSPSSSNGNPRIAKADGDAR